jgi:hypothetical protein
MRLLILYRPGSEHSRTIEEFVHNFQSLYHPDNVEIQDVDSREGIATIALYDIMQYPAIAVLTSDGVVQKIWQGPELPLMGEVAFVARG